MKFGVWQRDTYLQSGLATNTSFFGSGSTAASFLIRNSLFTSKYSSVVLTRDSVADLAVDRNE
jgi:hypothetical protein